MTIPSAVAHGFQTDGFSILREFSDSQTCDRITDSIDGLPARKHQRHRSSGSVRLRLCDEPVLREFAWSSPVIAVLEQFCGTRPFPVRALLFDKTPSRNWRVGWHQDTSIAVLRRKETAGFCGWSIKAGIVHAQAPAVVLESMMTLRLHLDDCGPNNGALQIIPGSHRRGVLGPGDVDGMAKAEPKICCEARRGDLLVMRPLLVHSSSPVADSACARRRVLHIEYATRPLPGGLEWFEQGATGS